MLKILYGLLMLLPQGHAFKTLSTRLQSVATLGMLQFVPDHTLDASRQPLEDEGKDIDIDALSERFIDIQSKHAALQRQSNVILYLCRLMY